MTECQAEPSLDVASNRANGRQPAVLPEDVRSGSGGVKYPRRRHGEEIVGPPRAATVFLIDRGQCLLQMSAHK